MTAGQIDIGEILGLLPHRYPFIMVDRILSVEEGRRIKGLKNVTINEPFFQGHFPGVPVMPGVMILEGLAQVGAIMAYLAEGENTTDKLVYFAGMDKVRFRKKVAPGDQLILEAVTVKKKMSLWTLDAAAYVDGKVAAEARMMATFR